MFTCFPLSSSSWCRKNPRAWELHRIKNNSSVTAWLQNSVRSTLLSLCSPHSLSLYFELSLSPTPQLIATIWRSLCKVKMLCVLSNKLLFGNSAPFYWEVSGFLSSLIIYSAIRLQVHSYHQMAQEQFSSHTRGSILRERHMEQIFWTCSRRAFYVREIRKQHKEGDEERIS